MKLNFGGSAHIMSGLHGRDCSDVSLNLLQILQVWIILLSFSVSKPGSCWSSVMAKSVLDHNILGPPPVFDDFTIREVEATEGQTLLLPCTVRYLGDKVVSWIRSRDLHILTSGPFTFSSDNRFEVVPSSAGDFWGLRIRGVHTSDAGKYECQINTDPKMSLAINLTISGVRKLESTNSKWVGQALIKGSREVYVRDGSPVTFTCEISPLSVASLHSGAHGVFMTAKPRVRWLHDNKELLSEVKSRGISMETFYGETEQKVIGILKISKVSWRDSGQYTCLQMSVKPDNVNLFVVENEHSEAMQRDYPVSSRGSRKITKLIVMLLFIMNLPTH